MGSLVNPLLHIAGTIHLLGIWTMHGRLQYCPLLLHCPTKFGFQCIRNRTCNALKPLTRKALMFGFQCIRNRTPADLNPKTVH